MLNDRDAAVVVIGVDNDAQRVEEVATHARDHVLSRAVDDWDAAEQDALEALKQAEALPSDRPRANALRDGLDHAVNRAVKR